MRTHGTYPDDWDKIAWEVKERAGWKCLRCDHKHCVGSYHVLTVHHFDGDKSNCVWWNLLALCQRCHLRIQGRVDPETPYFLAHSVWIEPYVAGFYADKYLKEKLSREEVEARIDELLALELRI